MVTSLSLVNVYARHKYKYKWFVYVVFAPKAFCVGTLENIVIQAHGYTESFSVNIALKSYPDKSFTYSLGLINLSPENRFQGSANLNVDLIDLAGEGNAVSHVYLEVVSAHFSKTTEIPLRYDNGFIFIQTDKSIYFSNEKSVKVRAYSLDEDLQPSQREVTLTFIDPGGKEMDLVGTYTNPGIIAFPDFEIPSFPDYGLWTVKAKYKEDFTTTATAFFELKIHGKPQFYVIIEPENSIISHKNVENFKITIKARFSYSRNLPEAKVFVLFNIKEDLYDGGHKNIFAGIESTNLVDGVAQINFNASKEIKRLNKSLEDLNNKFLNIFVDVEASIFVHEDKEAVVKFVLFPYTLDLVDTSLFLKPGLPFLIKVQVKDTDGHLVRGIPVTMEAKTTYKTDNLKTDLDIKQSTTNYDGVASFVIYTSSDVAKLDFHVKTDDPDLPAEYQASNDYQAVPYSSQSQSFLSLSWPENYKDLVVGEHLDISVTPKSPYVDKITHYNYLISSKGKIVHFGAEKKLPGSSSQLLNLPLTQHMAPTACLLVYYFVTGDQTTELVSDSVCLKIQEKCGNQLRIHLSPNNGARPRGKGISLTLETQSEAWVALSSVDVAAYHFQQRSTNPMEKILHSSSKRGRDCGAGGGRNNAEVLYSTGLTVLTNVDAGHSQREGGSRKKILRSKRELKNIIESLASTYQHPLVQNCCRDGAHESEDSCEKRAARIKVGPRCSKAFSVCCERANFWRLESTHLSAPLRAPPVFEPRKKSTINWLWKVYHVPKRHQVDLTLPYSPSTWEIQAVSISNKGLCATDVMQLKVYEDHFLVINDSAPGANEEGHFQHPDSRT
ncbi:complement C5-like [Sorex araneus]|uniref:complement C5-like n=1 Tax=Sorex araneus TaxID=42254 RepID=UPI002433D7A2|nr:complement C5-like [Sorex araneus]